MFTSGRPQTPKRTRQISMESVGWKKKKRKQDKTCVAERELKRKKGSRTLGSILTRREVPWDGKGASEAKEESATTGLWQAGQRETCKDGRWTAWAMCPLVRAGLGAKTQSLEGSPGMSTVIDCMGRAWRAWNVVQLQPGLFEEEAGASHRRKVPLLSCIRREG